MNSGRIGPSSVRMLLCSYLLTLPWLFCGITFAESSEPPPTGQCSSTDTAASSFSTRQAFTRAAVNKAGNLVISLDDDADGRVEQVMRFKFSDQAHAEYAAATWNGAEIELEFREWTVANSPVIQFMVAQNEQPESFVIAPSHMDCLQAFLERQRLTGLDLYPAEIISKSRLPYLDQKSHAEVLSMFDNYPLVRKGDQEHAPESKDPLMCFAGGPGAIACSWSAGDIGPIQGGGCSIECPPGTYACCGPGWGSYCSCISTGNGSGGGGSGDGGPGGGGGSGGDGDGDGDGGGGGNCEDPPCESPPDDDPRGAG